MVNVLLGLYAVSLFTSLAAMEIVGPLLWLAGFFCALKSKSFCKPSLLVSVSLGGLIATAVLSFYLNDITIPFLKYIGEWRWVLAYLGLTQFFFFYRSRISWSSFLNIAQIVIILLSFYSIYQLFYAHDFFRSQVFFHSLYGESKYYRPNGMFNLPTTYAHVVSLFFAFSLPLLIFRAKSKPWETYLTRVFFILAPLSIAMTFTRAAWISTSAWLFGFLSQKKVGMFKKLFGVFCLLITISYLSSGSVRGRVNSIFDMSYYGNSQRLYLWQANFLIFQDHPFFGMGYEVDTKREIVASYLQKVTSENVMKSHAHSTYVNFLSGLGGFGFFFLLLFVFANIKNTLEGLALASDEQQKSLFWGLLGAQFVFLIGAFSECMLEDAEVNHQYILYLAILQAYLQYLKQARHQPSSDIFSISK